MEFIQRKRKHNDVNSQIVPNTSIDFNVDSKTSDLVIIEKQPLQKRKRYMFQEKRSILNEAKIHPVQFICDKYKICDRTLRQWKADEVKIKEISTHSYYKSTKKINNISVMDQTLFTWLVDAQTNGIPVSGRILKQQAIAINKKLGGSTEFRASEGWLQRWKIRNNVKSLKNTDEPKEKWSYSDDKYTKCVEKRETDCDEIENSNEDEYLLPHFETNLKGSEDEYSSTPTMSNLSSTNVPQTNCPPLVFIAKPSTSNQDQQYDSMSVDENEQNSVFSIHSDRSCNDSNSQTTPIELINYPIKTEDEEFILSDVCDNVPGSPKFYDSITIKNEPIIFPTDDASFDNSKVSSTTINSKLSIHPNISTNDSPTTNEILESGSKSTTIEQTVLESAESGENSFQVDKKKKKTRLQELQEAETDIIKLIKEEQEQISMINDKKLYTEDELFLLSLAPSLSRLKPQKKALLKIKIQQLLYDAEFQDSN